MAELLRSTSTPTVSTLPAALSCLSQPVRKTRRTDQGTTERTAVWLVSAQPSRAVALLEEHDCISRFVPNTGDSNAISRLIEQNTLVALKVRGTAELEGLQLPAWRIALVTDREFFGQQSLSSRVMCAVAARPPANG